MTLNPLVTEMDKSALVLHQEAAEGNLDDGTPFQITSTHGLGGLDVFFIIGDGDDKRRFKLDVRKAFSEVVDMVVSEK